VSDTARQVAGQATTFSADTPLALRRGHVARLYRQSVGLTGIIYGSIVVAWAAYLVPFVLRRHDEAARSRSVDRFSSSMRVLSRHGRAASGRVVVGPPRTTDRVLRPGLSRTGSTAPGISAARPSRAALAAAARRRRRILVGLLIGTAVVAAAGVLGAIPLWSLAVPVAMVAGFLLVARRQVRRVSDSYWVQERAAAPAASSNVIRRGSTRVEASHGATKNPDEEPTVPLDAENLKAAVAGLVEERSVAVPLPTADGSSLWDPLPIMLPTYVDKPVARRTIRTIDVGEPAARSATQAATVADSTAAAATAASPDRTAAVGADAALDVEPARVVNG
jgi:hypothetical protein